MFLSFLVLLFCSLHDGGSATKIILGVVAIPKCGTRTLAKMLSKLGFHAVGVNTHGTAFFSSEPVSFPKDANFGGWKYTFPQIADKRGLIHATLPEVLEKWRQMSPFLTDHQLVTVAVFREPVARAESEIFYRNWAFNMRSGGEWADFPSRQVLSWVWGWGRDYDKIAPAFNNMTWNQIMHSFCTETWPAHTRQSLFLVGDSALRMESKTEKAKLVEQTVLSVNITGTIENFGPVCVALLQYAPPQANSSLCRLIESENVAPERVQAVPSACQHGLIRRTWLDRVVFAQAQLRELL